MTKEFIYFIVTLFLSIHLFAQGIENQKFYGEVKLKLINQSDIERADELIKIKIDELKLLAGNFNQDAFIVYTEGMEIPSQIYTSCNIDHLILTLDIQPNEEKVISVKFLKQGVLAKDYKFRTYAELAMKFDAVYKKKKFVGDRFQNYSKVIVPEIHTDHDALFKYEGPGWESEKVGYRFYLDWRNANDVFGKKVDELVLKNVGINDVVAKDDSYHNMQDWGMDIFKVGSSLGIGSIGMMHDSKIEMVSKTDKVMCEIPVNGPLISEIRTTYLGWQVGGSKYDLISSFSISAGSRFTNVNLDIRGNAENIVTGLAKYEGIELINSIGVDGWNYIAMFGKQSLSGDNLGTVLFYNKNNTIELGEDELSYYVKLRPVTGKVKYLFGAAWEQELDGIKSKSEFIKFIDRKVIKLNNPIKIEIN